MGLKFKVTVRIYHRYLKQNSTKQLRIVTPNEPTWVGSPTGCYHLPRHLLLLLGLKCDTHFTISQRVKGNGQRMHSTHAQGYIT